MKKNLFIMALTLTLLLSGCGKEKENSTNITDDAPKITESVNVTPQSGGVLKLSMRTTQTLNPLLNEDASVDNILKLVYEPLIKIDENYKATPNIAESWSFSEDGTVLTIKLKSGIMWHDGGTLNAGDVVYSINTLKQKSVENAVYKKCVSNISGASAIDNNTVKVTFNSVYSGNIYSMTFPIISSSFFGTGDKDTEMMGNGPFEFSSFQPAKELKLKKAANSFDSTPFIDEVSVIITPDNDTDLYSFDQGITDCVAANETDLSKYDNSSKTRNFEFTTNYYDFIGFNFNRSILQDINVRKAIAYAVPKEGIIENVYLSHAIDAHTPINPKSWLFEPETAKYEYSLAQSKTLLEASNWKDTDNDKIRDKKTNEYSEKLKLTILVNEENDERHQIAKRLMDELKSIGFDIAVDAQPFDVYTQKLIDKDFDIFIGGWQLSVIPDLSFMFRSTGNSNFISYNSAAMDTALDATSVAIGETSTIQSFSDLQKLIAEQVPYVSIVFRNSAVFANKSVYGELKPLENNIFDNIEKWFIYSENTNKK